MDMCKQAKSDWHQSNLIQSSTTRQDPKSEGFRDLIGDLIGDGIRPGQSYLYGCTGIAWDAMLCMGRMIVEHSSIFFISPSWELVTDSRLSAKRKCLAVLVHGWWSSSGVEWSKPLSCHLLCLGGVDSPSVCFPENSRK